MKVILYFFVAGVNFVSSMYGFLPPIFAPSCGTIRRAAPPGENHRDAENAEGRRYKTEFKKPCHPEGWRYKNLRRKLESNSKPNPNFKGASQRPAVQRQIQRRRRDAGGTKKLNVVQALAFQGRLQCAVH